MKAIKVILVAVCFMMTAMMLVPTTMAIPQPHIEIPLLAGQHTEIGYISVWNDDVNLHVTYVITEAGWELIGTHLYVGKTNPNTLTTAPGQFPYSNANGVYVIPLSSICYYQMQVNNKGARTGKMIPSGAGSVPTASIYIAAHADVRLLKSTDYNELITNGGFETPAIVGDSGWMIVTDETLPGYGWTTVPNVPDTFGDPEELEIQKGILGVTAYEGLQWAELDAYYPVILSQVAACQSGDYLLSYAYAPRPGNPVNQITVAFGNYYVGHSASTGSWTHVSQMVTGPTTGTASLIFTETGPDDQLGMLLDDVSLKAVVYNYEYESAWAQGTDFTQPNWAMYFTYNLWHCIGQVHVSAAASTPTVSSFNFVNCGFLN